MSVFFGVPLKRMPNGSVGVGNSDLLWVDDALTDDVFDGWRSDLTIDVMDMKGLRLTKSHSDEVFLVLKADYYTESFEREFIVAPKNQFVRCWWLEKHCEMDESVCDVVIVTARYWDVFCVAGKEMNRFLVVGDNNIQVFERPVGQGLFNNGDCRNVLFGESQLSYMEKENLGFHMWREVLPLYHQ